MASKKSTPKSEHIIPIVAIVGRPNVGKSSLFNRLIRKRLAVTHEQAGTTRDRIYFQINLEGIPAIVVDTGGLEYGKKENIEADIQSQARIAIDEADIIVFVADMIEGLTANDYEAATMLRKSGKTVVFIANKYDHPGHEEHIGEMTRLGFGEPLKVSAIHKTGIEEFRETLAQKLKKAGWKKQQERAERKEDTVSVCFLGRPNAGKSSLVNAILGEEKLIVSPVAGTTRDSTDTEIIYDGQKYTLIDTAGLRRRGRIEPGLEKLSALRSLEALERSDIACLILDYERGIRKQDLSISSYIQDARKGLILVVNKSDLMKDPESDRNRFVRVLRHRFDFLPWVPVLFVSALKKKNIEKILGLSQEIYRERFKQIGNEELDGFMKEITHRHIPPKVTLTTPKIYSLEQTGINPPTFTFWVNDDKAFHFSYRRYLENEIRKKYGFNGTGIRLIYKNKTGKKKN
jgi:GTP-binding protein